MIVPNASVVSPYCEGTSLYEVLEMADKTALVFHRFYGCRFTRYAILDYSRGYEAIQGKGGQILMVLQSKPEIMLQELRPGEVPFPILCDPEGKLYELFAVKPGSSEEQVLKADKCRETVEKAVAAGIVKGTPEGDPMQLPAVLILDREKNLLARRDGCCGADVPSAEELAAMLG